MKRYETIFIADPDLSEEERGQIVEKTNNLINNQNGYVVEFDEWGSRKLAYDIGKKNRGYYIRIDYCGDGPLVDEMERTFRIDDRILKFMTILLETNVNLDKVKEEAAKIKEEKIAKQEKAAIGESDDPKASPRDEENGDYPDEFSQDEISDEEISDEE